MAKKVERVEATIKVDDKGSMKKTQKSADKTAKSMGKVSNESNKLKRNLEGVAQRSGNTTKDFSRMSQGMGGLVAAYATVAANVFALSTAFNLLKRSADFDSMIISSQNLSAATGSNFLGVARSVQKATGSQLDYADSLKLTNKALASGIGEDKLANFTELATKAAQTFGGSTTDSLNRMIDAVLRGRTELVNKMGIIITAEEAYENYAAATGKAANELTSFEKRQALTNAIIEKGNESLGQTVIDPNPFEVLAVTFRDLGQDIFSFATASEGFLTQILNLFNESKTAAFGLSTVVIGSVLKSLRADEDAQKRRRTAARKNAKRAEARARVQGKKLNRINEEILLQRTKADEAYTRKRLQLFAQRADEATPKEKLGGKLKSVDAALRGEQLTAQQIRGARKSLAAAEKGTGALANVPKNIRKQFERELDFMEKKAGKTEAAIRKHSTGIGLSLKRVEGSIKQAKNTWNSNLASMQRQYAVASTKIARKGIFTSLPSNMSLAAKSAARLTGVFNKLIGSLGTIGLLLAAGTALWEWYSNNFRQAEKRIEDIENALKGLQKSQANLNDTLETSREKFDSLIGKDTAQAFQQRLKIMGNNISSIIALLKETQTELNSVANTSAEVLKQKELEVDLKNKTGLIAFLRKERKRLKEEGEFKQAIAIGAVIEFEEFKKEKLESKLKEQKRLIQKSSRTLLISLRDQAQSAFTDIEKSAFERIGEVGLDGKLNEWTLPEEAGKVYSELQSTLEEINNINLNGGEESVKNMNALLEQFSKRSSLFADIFKGAEAGIGNLNKANASLATALDTTDTDISALGKTASTVWKELFNTSLQDEAANLTKRINDKLIPDTVNGLSELQKALGFKPDIELPTSEVLKEYDRVKDVLKGGATFVVTAQFELKNLEQELQRLKTTQAQTSNATDRLELDRQISAQLDLINKKEISILEKKIEVQKTLKFTNAQAEAANQRNIQALEQQLDFLRDADEATLAKYNNEKQSLALTVQQLQFEKSRLQQQQQLEILSQDLLIAQQGGIALDVKRETRRKEDLQLQQKAAQLQKDINIANAMADSDEKQRQLELLKLKQQQLELEGKIVKEKRKQDFRGNAQDLASEGGTENTVAAIALSFQADIVDAINKADSSINRLSTSFATGIRAGVQNLLQGIMDGNASLKDAISAMGEAVSSGIVEYFTDQFTSSLLQLFGVPDEAKVFHNEAQTTREKILAAIKDSGKSDTITTTGVDSQGKVAPVSQAQNMPLGTFVMPDRDADLQEQQNLINAETENTGALSFLSNTVTEHAGIFQVVGLGMTQSSNKLVQVMGTLITVMATQAAGSEGGIFGALFGAATGQANGGVVSNTGPVGLANGGIATKAQHYIIGEGRKNEAVVPLPNNREIPVVMQGESGGDTYVNNYDFSGADPATEARIRNMIEANGAKTFNKVFHEMDRGGMYSKKAGRRR